MEPCVTQSLTSVRGESVCGRGAHGSFAVPSPRAQAASAAAGSEGEERVTAAARRLNRCLSLAEATAGYLPRHRSGTPHPFPSTRRHHIGGFRTARSFSTSMGASGPKAL